MYKIHFFNDSNIQEAPNVESRIDQFFMDHSRGTSHKMGGRER